MKTLTIVICSNRPENIFKFFKKSIPECVDVISEVIIIFDKNVFNKSNHYKIKSDNDKIKVIYSELSGLSNLRNHGLNLCTTDSILFFDDDVSFNREALGLIIKKLDIYDIVGLKLRQPNSSYFKRWYITENQYHYLGIHSSENNNSIWGACMAFNMSNIGNLKFDKGLGRQANKFMSGEDSLFIEQLKISGCSFCLDTYGYVIHNVDPARLSFKSMVCRVYWQGITEVKRGNTYKGFLKEFSRNFVQLSLINVTIGLFWLLVFITGLIFSIFYERTK